VRLARAVKLAAMLAATAAGPASAAQAEGTPASRDLQTGIADDRLLLSKGAKPEAVAKKWARLGIDSVRIHARWIAVVPAPEKRRKPRDFDPSDPDDPSYNWGALDAAVSALRANGIEPILAVTGSGPVWASRNPALDNPRYKPDPRQFGRFATAVATRFGPAVDRYLIWNEPNIPGWLQPQFSCRRGRCVPESPHIYRELFRFAASAIRRADPGSEVLFGTLAPRGGKARSTNATTRPLAFLRAMGCVTATYRSDRTGRCRTAKPVRADGFSYHPHPIGMAADEHAPDRDDAAIGDLGRLTTALDRTTRAGIVKPVRGRRFDIHLTEFGYQTNPPDRNVGVSPALQARWVQQGTYLAWKSPRIKTITQYEYKDEPLATNTTGSDRFSGWQSGMLFSDGRPKPLLAAFPNPFWAEVRRGRSSVRFWGQVRPGDAHRVRLQRRLQGAWATVRILQTDPSGYWSADVVVRAPGDFRFSYELPRPDGDGMVARASPSRRVEPGR